MSVGVVVDALPVHFGGGGTALVEQLAALERVAPDLELHVLAAPWNAAALRAALGSEVRGSDVRTVTVADGASRVVWEQLALPWLGRRPGVLYCPGNLAPLAPTRLPVVLAVQNPNLVGRGRRLPHNRRWGRRLRVAACQVSMRRARWIVAVSESLRAEVVADQPRLADRVSVVPLGPPAVATPSRRPAALRPEVHDYVLVLANDAPHKRLDDAVAAWGRAFGEHPDRAPHLVLAGRVEPRRRADHRHLVPAGLRPRLVHLGPVVDRREVTWLLGHARVLVAASELESFGLTTLEAGALGCPLLLSDIPAHREVAGTHATFSPVRDVAALAGALARTEPAPERRPWSWPVSWDEHAERLAAVLRRAAGVG
jgi:glycosyltransferase involved in cell wall biosynthesis